MKTTVPGYKYELPNSSQKGFQVIQFEHSEFNKLYNEDVIIKEGTSTKEVLEMLIDKFEFDNKLEADESNELILKRLNKCLEDVNKMLKEKTKDDSQLKLAE